MSRALVCVLALVVAMPAVARETHEALELGDLICEFRDGWRRNVFAASRAGPASPDLMLMYEQVRPDSAEVLSTRKPGRRAVAVRTTPHGLYFVQREGASVMVTALGRCEARRWRRGVDACVRYAATHAWHFDTSAAFDPDGAAARQPSGAAIGRCEPWSVD